MDNLSREIINRYQGGFPLVERPFAELGKELDADEKVVIHSIQKLLKSRVLSRFGPLYNAAGLGGALTLAAVSVPQEDFLTVSAQINSLPEVAHNYRRDHELNMWFVLATETPAAIQNSILLIEQITGLRVYSFPKLREYYLGLWLNLDSYDRVSTRSFETGKLQNGYKLDKLDRCIIRSTQSGLPIIPEPYKEIARSADSDIETVFSRMQTMLDFGVIRRIGAVPNHYCLGLSSNGMSVWNVNDLLVDELGATIGQLDFVSHCYLRPRYEGIWSYNLFAMVHGHSQDEVTAKVTLISDLLGDNCQQSDVLFSSSILKKTGLRLVA